MTADNAKPFDLFIVGGLGHVGLPFGLVFADAGLRVGLYDLDRSRRAIVETGSMPFLERGGEEILRRVLGKNLHLCDELQAAQGSECVVITIGTPLDEHQNPSLLPMLDLAKGLGPHLRPGHHVMLRSTVFPGTSRRLADFISSRDREVHVSFCPERIVQGEAVHELKALPQIISGCDEAALAAARRLFGGLGIATIEVSVEEAEVAKLFLNSWRYMQFAIANQFYMMASEMGVDFFRLYHAMTHGYARARDLPGPGFAAGPCLLKDTLQIAAFHNTGFQLGHAAVMVNEGLPNFIVGKVRESVGEKLVGMRVGVLGMSFKRDSDDIRDSLSYKLVKILRFHGALPQCSDEFVRDPSFVSKEEALACPVVIVGVPHSAYDGLTPPEHSLVIDPWRVLAARPAELKADRRPSAP